RYFRCENEYESLVSKRRRSHNHLLAVSQGQISIDLCSSDVTWAAEGEVSLRQLYRIRAARIGRQQHVVYSIFVSRLIWLVLFDKLWRQFCGPYQADISSASSNSLHYRRDARVVLVVQCCLHLFDHVRQIVGNRIARRLSVRGDQN